MEEVPGKKLLKVYSCKATHLISTHALPAQLNSVLLSAHTFFFLIKIFDLQLLFAHALGSDPSCKFWTFHLQDSIHGKLTLKVDGNIIYLLIAQRD